MSISSIIEVTIGLIFVYLMLSLVCSSLNEIIAHIFRLRAATLKKGIERLLTDQNIREEFFAHPLIKSLGVEDSTVEKVKVSYIPSRSFATALIDIVASNDPACDDAKDPVKLRAAIKSLESQSEDLSKALRAIFNSADDKLEQARENVEKWFDDAMERVTGWYKKMSQWILLCLSFILVVTVNVDTIDLAIRLWQNPALRQQITLAADKYVTETESKVGEAKPKDIKEALEKFNAQLKEVKKLNIPIGWSTAKLPQGWDQWFWKIIGLIFTTLAVSLGAPFWFDLLNKVTRLRVSGDIPKKAGGTKK
ncbi:MAG: hypothetical protein KAV87_18170 [Desulfobacteraceae bacterium]|nr:hypothetical protein [Desulfobacteraceae bacterium]